MLNLFWTLAILSLLRRLMLASHGSVLKVNKALYQIIFLKIDSFERDVYIKFLIDPL